MKFHKIENCNECGAPLKDEPLKRYIIRQVIDITDIKVKVTEHRAEIKICPHCKNKNTGEFPDGVVSRFNMVTE